MKKAKARSKTIPTIVRIIIRRTLLELSLFPIEISPNDERDKEGGLVEENRIQEIGHQTGQGESPVCL